MPTLHNQTKSKLSWEMSGTRYECDPWGGVDVPDELVSACKSRGLPLDSVPVAPELRARVRMADEVSASRNSDLKRLSDQVREAEAARDTAKAELEKAQVALSKMGDRVRGLEDEKAKLLDRIDAMESDKKAAEELVTETAAKAVESEERALRAEAQLKESSGKKRK